MMVKVIELIMTAKKLVKPKGKVVWVSHMNFAIPEEVGRS